MMPQEDFDMEVLVINPGSTSTKIAIYQDENPIYTESISHTPADLAPFPGVLDQLEYRLGMIRAALDKAGFPLSELEAVSARGGFTKPAIAPCPQGARCQPGQPAGLGTDKGHRHSCLFC